LFLRQWTIEGVIVPEIVLFACESQPVVIEGLERVLERAGGFRLAGWAPSCQEALDRIPLLRPRIVLIDQTGGLKQVFRFLGDLKVTCAECLAVLWVSDLAEADCFRAVQVGARGILKKNLPVETMIECLRAVASGDVWMENTILSASLAVSDRRPAPRLTPREREIVHWLCKGLRNKEIAGELSITPGTVKVHLMHIFEKTGVKDRFELAVHGRRLLGLEPETAVGNAPEA
jgi:DNA-binding NarL/FixJ family response regulator